MPENQDPNPPVSWQDGGGGSNPPAGSQIIGSTTSFGGYPGLGSSASLGDAIVTVGGSGVWEIVKIIASYYQRKALRYNESVNFGQSARGRLCVVRGAAVEMSPGLGSGIFGGPSYTSDDDYLANNKPESLLLDIPWNPGQQGSNDEGRTLHLYEPTVALPLVLDFPRGCDIGGLRTDEGGQLSVVLFAGTVADDTDAVIYPFVQALHVCAYRVRRQ